MNEDRYRTLAREIYLRSIDVSDIMRKGYTADSAGFVDQLRHAENVARAAISLAQVFEKVLAGDPTKAARLKLPTTFEEDDRGGRHWCKNCDQHLDRHDENRCPK